MTRPTLILAALAALTAPVSAFVAPHPTFSRYACLGMSSDDSSDNVLDQVIAMMSGGETGAELETPDMVQGRIQALVDQHPVLLFMKGAKRFPQCGFSDTATKILDRYAQELDFDFHTVDVLEDLMVREGVKVFSQWPTIPQLYVGGEFVGGSDIMLEMYESGELKEMLEKAAKKEEN